ncbi:ABC transporter ATP-binding protein [Lactococcus garvieae subsp. garvieae]|uniref:Multidrug ABC transporter ATP-binding protein n=2 Tax=Lactococcus garvieae TaxID=1363 RepID=V8ATN7_9LACT|nr:ABC transporter ATP-binding protein [Lactococcus garvieae]ETD05511.1 multidrug ABC transporter ATP-binding protein [Lactococcus garvieae TRF1]KAA8711999.1 ABC transporter ATP-binding protein [Lactococcus garvieae subsp. garvieae]MDG6191603.1 ABC transporter ATP-binding protein [Lactococcus garvieae]QPR49785.1 ABC transporter ATP-binding protein [Lactococcus garvieae]
MSLKIKEISKTYGKNIILDNVSINIEPQKIYGLLGNNGAGKSTLLNIINNRIFSTTGKVELSGESIFDNEKYLNRIYLMSEDDLYPSKLKINSLFKLTEKFYGEFDWDLAHQMLEEFELNPSKHLNKLSTGYRSITKLIVALCVPCEYIFLDEPVLGLDANHREMFYNFLLDTYQERLRTFVISTHLIEEISNLLERVIILDKGKIIDDKELEQLLYEAYVLSGSTNEIEDLLKDVQVLDKEVLGGATTVYIKGHITRKSLGNIKVTPMSLQDYFKKVTSRKKAK